MLLLLALERPLAAQEARSNELIKQAPALHRQGTTRRLHLGRDTQPVLVLAANLLYGAISPPREFTKAKFTVKLKFFAPPVAAALSILYASAFAGGSLATNHSSQQPSQTRGVVPEQDTKAQVASELSGHYFALVIGINNYEHLPKLRTAVQDAQALDSILRDQYGFQTTILVDATRDRIMKALNDYRHNLDENTSLLIYYAGHGMFEKETNRAYWLPADAEQDDHSHWIMADDVTTEVRAIQSRHVIIISDSCYSGGMSRDVAPSYTQEERERYLQKFAVGKSRNLMSSGALEPVSDEGGGGHSVFAGALIKALTTSSEEVFSADGLFHQYVQLSVAGRSDQTPQYIPIRDSGHDFGDFVFVRSGKAPAASAAQRAEHNAAPQIVASQPAPARQPAAPPRPAYNPPAAAPAEMHAKNVLASRTYGGIRFDVTKVNTNDSKAPVVLISATNTQQRDLKFKLLKPPDAKIIDSNGIASDRYGVEGVPICLIQWGDVKKFCATPEANGWSVAYSGTPLNFALKFRSPQDFRGSSVNVSFDVLLGTEKDDGSINSTFVPVILPNVSLNPDVPVRPAVASRAYKGIKFDVTSVQTGDKTVSFLIAATNTQQRDLKFKLLKPPDAKIIDSNGIASDRYGVEGVPICLIQWGDVKKFCATPEANGWSEAYSDVPLTFLLTFSGPREFRGSSVNISFDVLLGTEKDDGSINSTFVPVILPNVPLDRDAPVRTSLASRTYAGINFDVMRMQADEKAVRVLVAATNTQQEDLRLKLVKPPDAKIIDSNGIASDRYGVEGVPICLIQWGDVKKFCATPEANGWTEAYSQIPLYFLLTFSGPQEFRGSSANVSFDALLGAEKDDGSIKPTLVHVVLPDVPLTR